MASELARIRADTVTQVLRQLAIAQRLIVARLRRESGDSLTRQRLTALQREVERHMEGFRTGATAAASTGATAALRDGFAEVIGPLRAQGIDFTPRKNPRQLTAMQVNLTSLIADISTSTRHRINTQLGQVLIGTQPLAAAVTRVQQLLGGAARSRAKTIVYTEIGRINSAATQAGMEEAARRIPGMRKRWVHSAKKHPRRDHIAVHGQLRLVHEPFDVGGEKLMYPRDPAGSARNTINCGCRHIPVVDGSRWGASTARIDVRDPAAALTLQLTGTAVEAAARTLAPTVVQDAGGVVGSAQTAAALWETRAVQGLPSALADVLVPLERELATRPVEWAVVLDMAGRTLFTQQGELSAVRISGLSTSTARGQVLTHNHPAGSPASIQDVFTAAGFSLAELRAVSTDSRQRLLPPVGGWRLGELLEQEDELRRYARGVRDRLLQQGAPAAEYDRRIAAALLEELVRRNLLRLETSSP